MALSNDMPLSGNTADEICRTFVEGEPGLNKFYSPGWPNPYPNHTDCVLILEAPRGYVLKLDFRDCFDLEPSTDCRFDFLEVRDGAHGYCDLLGQFCGKEFPPVITSSDRYLWLRFHSDENIEYAGFKAVYEYVPRAISSSYTPELDTCRIHVTGNEGIFSSEDIPLEHYKLVEMYKVAIDCMWVITVKEGWKVQLSFPEFKLEKPNDCDNNFVDVFSDRTDLPSRQKNFCGSIADSVTSKNNLVFVRFFTTAKAVKSKFTAMYTAFREKSGGEVCSEDEWDCEDTTCISINLRCNGRINCRFRWDEDNCMVNKTMALNSEHIIIIMVVFSFILSGMCLTFIFHCFKKLIRDYQFIQEHMRSSCEQQLHILGHKSEIPVLMGTGDQYCRTHSIQNLDRQYDSVVMDADSCYVPDNQMTPILPHNPHIGAHVFLTTNNSFEQPEMCDNGCQTKESLSCSYEHKTASSYRSDVPLKNYGCNDRYFHENLIEEDLSEKVMWCHNDQAVETAPDVITTH